MEGRVKSKNVGNIYDEMTQEEFDTILQRLVEDEADKLLSVPGVYEAVSEHYNNQVLEIWAEEKGLTEEE